MVWLAKPIILEDARSSFRRTRDGCEGVRDHSHLPTRRTAIGTVVAAGVAPSLAFGQQTSAEKVPLKRLSDYLNDLARAKANFKQTNFDGSEATGVVYLHRPWRIRLEYDPPAKLLVLAAGRRLYVFDLKSNYGPEEYPLDFTPFYPILANDLNLTRNTMVSGHYANDRLTWIVLRDPQRRTQDSVSLVFRKSPLELAGWEYNHASGETTLVAIHNLEPVEEMPAILFNAEWEKQRIYGG